MQTKFTFTNLDSSPSLIQYVEKKLDKLSRILTSLDPDGSGLVSLEVIKTTRHHHKGDIYQTKINLDLPHRFCRASAKDEKIQSAVDAALDKLKEEVEKYKEQYFGRRRELRAVRAKQ